MCPRAETLQLAVHGESRHLRAEAILTSGSPGKVKRRERTKAFFLSTPPALHSPLPRAWRLDGTTGPAQTPAARRHCVVPRGPHAWPRVQSLVWSTEQHLDASASPFFLPTLTFRGQGFPVARVSLAREKSKTQNAFIDRNRHRGPSARSTPKGVE